MNLPSGWNERVWDVAPIVQAVSNIAWCVCFDSSRRKALKINKSQHLKFITAILMTIHHIPSMHPQCQVPQLVHLHKGSQITHVVAVIRCWKHRKDFVVVIRCVTLQRTRSFIYTVIANSWPRIRYLSPLRIKKSSDSFGPYVWLIPRVDTFQPFSFTGSDHNRSQNKPSWKWRNDNHNGERIWLVFPEIDRWHQYHGWTATSDWSQHGRRKRACLRRHTKGGNRTFS